MGGSDQCGNIVAGIELVRKIRQETVFGITFPLITTSSGAKMGKTADGAVWLDPKKTSPYDYYQYWINTDDRDVARFMALFTFLPMEEIENLGKLSGEALNNAKAVLAFEATQIAHGRQEALKAYFAAQRMFGVRVVPEEIMPSSSIIRNGSESDNSLKTGDLSSLDSEKLAMEALDSIPHSDIEEYRFKDGIPAFKLYHQVGMTTSGTAARKLIEQGGAYVNGRRVTSFDYLLTKNDIVDFEIILRAGKKRYHKLKIIKNNA
jgi:tyrosyl-tRNA synthetase